jgi:hypothetical protein
MSVIACSISCQQLRFRRHLLAGLRDLAGRWLDGVRLLKARLSLSAWLRAALLHDWKSSQREFGRGTGAFSGESVPAELLVPGVADLFEAADLVLQEGLVEILARLLCGVVGLGEEQESFAALAHVDLVLAQGL